MMTTKTSQSWIECDKHPKTVRISYDSARRKSCPLCDAQQNVKVQNEAIQEYERVFDGVRKQIRGMKSELGLTRTAEELS